MKNEISEGMVVSIPLINKRALGVVARKSPKYGILLMYFFSLDNNININEFDLSCLNPLNASQIFRVGDVFLKSGRWSYVGTIPKWDRNAWPLPKFFRTELLSQRSWVVQYSDLDPSLVQSEFKIDHKSNDMYKDGLYSASAVEAIMSKSSILDS